MVTQVKPGYSFVSNAAKNDSCHEPVLTKELILNGRIMKSFSFSEEDTSRLLLRLTINMNIVKSIYCVAIEVPLALSGSGYYCA